MLGKNSQIVLNVDTLSECIKKWFYGVAMYENIYNPMWNEVCKKSYFTNGRKIEISIFEEIVKSYLVPKSAKSLVSYCIKNCQI